MLAAGSGTRFAGRPKLLLLLGNEPLIRWPVRAALAAGFETVGVVVGHEAERTAAALEGLPVDVIRNPDFARGLSTSLARAARWARPRGDLLCLLGDEPGIDPDVIRRASEAWRADEPPALRTRYQDRPGHPVILSRELLEDLSPAGDRGFGPFFDDPGLGVAELRVDAPAPIDVDTRADYAEALARLPQ